MQIVTTLALGAQVVAVKDQLLQVLLLIAVKVQVLLIGSFRYHWTRLPVN